MTGVSNPEIMAAESTIERDEISHPRNVDVTRSKRETNVENRTVPATVKRSKRSPRPGSPRGNVENDLCNVICLRRAASKNFGRLVKE